MFSSEIFKLLGEPNRLKILLLLVDRKLPVNEIVSNLKISKSLVSHHLQLLKMKKIVKFEKYGKLVLYTLVKMDKNVLDIIEILSK